MSATTNPQAGRSPKQTHTPGDYRMIQHQRNMEHVMFGRLANNARAEGRIQLAETYERGMEMIARLYQTGANV